MDIWYRFKVILLVSLSCIGVDQATKLIASQYLQERVIHSYFSDVLRVGYTENIGAFLGLGNGFSEGNRFGLLVLGVGVLLMGMFVYLVINNKLRNNSLIGLSMVFSGGLSNFYDRLTNDGAVIDFLNLGIGSVRTGIFNIADIAIMVGVLLLLFSQKRNNLAV